MALITEFNITGDVVVAAVEVGGLTFKVACQTNCNDGGPEFIQAIQDHTGWLPGVNYFDGTSIINVVDVAGRTVWDWSTKAWVYALTVEDARVKKWLSIKASRTDAEYFGFLFNGNMYDSDEVSQRRISGAVSLAVLADDAFSMEWTVADNTLVTLSRTQMIGLGVALGHYVGSIHERARQKRYLIEAATTPEEVGAVVW